MPRLFTGLEVPREVGEVLSMSPLLLEKYVAAARTIVARAVPTQAAAAAETKIAGRRFGKPALKASEEPDAHPVHAAHIGDDGESSSAGAGEAAREPD